MVVREMCGGEMGYEKKRESEDDVMTCMFHVLVMLSDHLCYCGSEGGLKGPLGGLCHRHSLHLLNHLRKHRNIDRRGNGRCEEGKYVLQIHTSKQGRKGAI